MPEAKDSALVHNSWTLSPEDKVLLLGAGNVLLCDEGFGVHALNFLQENYLWSENVRLLDGGTLGLQLMPAIQDCNILVILDALLWNSPPGTIHVLDTADLNSSLRLPDSLHQTGLQDLLVFSELAGHKPKVLIIGMQMWDLQTLSPNLSPDAEQRLPEFCSYAIDTLAKYGIKATPKN